MKMPAYNTVIRRRGTPGIKEAYCTYDQASAETLGSGEIKETYCVFDQTSTGMRRFFP